jgi:4a-hydroxytetrahydrobiopterin dehydratase
MFQTKDWSATARQALSATQVVSALAKLEGWQLHGQGADVAIEKTFDFADYDETMAFVNAVAFIAKRQDHHPEMLVRYNRCIVRFNTHDVDGISSTDLECATQVDALLT